MKKIILIAVIVAGVVIYNVLNLGDVLTLENFAAQKQNISAYVEQNFVLTALLYALVYIVVFALALPVGAVLTLLGGALFGLAWGTFWCLSLAP